MVWKVAFFMLFVVSQGHSLKCYTCFAEKGQNSACEDLSVDRDKVKSEECSEGEVCVKYTTETPGTGHSLIKRSCGSKDTCENVHSLEHNKILDCKTCNTELCDSGTLTHASVIMLLISVLVVFVH